jgi:hypothetical protein
MMTKLNEWVKEEVDMYFFFLGIQSMEISQLVTVYGTSVMAVQHA